MPEIVFFFLALNSFIVKLDKRHTKTKKAPWITIKEQFIASPSKRPPPENCPKAFLTSDSTAANACVNNDCGNVRNCCRAWKQLALKLVQMKMLGKTMMRKSIFRMKKLMNKSQVVVKNQSLLMKAYFSDFYHPHAHVDNHDCLKKTHCYIS